jgi:hypothetical protein
VTTRRRRSVRRALHRHLPLRRRGRAQPSRRPRLLKQQLRHSHAVRGDGGKSRSASLLAAPTLRSARYPTAASRSSAASGAQTILKAAAPTARRGAFHHLFAADRFQAPEMIGFRR